MQSIAPEPVEKQLQRVLASTHFSHSRRYPAFLNYVVHQALKGHQGELKERIIGVEAFGRPADYDLNADPVVRVTAGEVRKRLAQYYYEPEHSAELRIELRPGSYIPEFNPPPEPGGAAVAARQAAQELPSHDSSRPAVSTWTGFLSRRGLRARLLLVSGGALAVLGIAAALWLQRTSPFDQFWRPVIDGPAPVLISVGSVTALLGPQQQPRNEVLSSVGGHPLSTDPIALADAEAFSNLQKVLSRDSKPSTLESAAETSFSDLQKGPAILISGFNNPWTMRLTNPLRFHFVQTAPSTFEIQDRTDPVHRNWAINTLTSFTSINSDYGIAARFQDPTTKQVIVVVAGIGENGTLAASKLISSRAYLVEARQDGFLPAHYSNWEAVVATQTIDGNPGPPRIVAAYSW